VKKLEIVCEEGDDITINVRCPDLRKLKLDGVIGKVEIERTERVDIRRSQISRIRGEVSGEIRMWESTLKDIDIQGCQKVDADGVCWWLRGRDLPKIREVNA
jgi:hypothetical protein